MESWSSVAVSWKTMLVVYIPILIFTILLFPHHHFIVRISIIIIRVGSIVLFTMIITILVLEIGIVCMMVVVSWMAVSGVTIVFGIIMFSTIWTTIVFTILLFRWFSDFISSYFNICLVNYFVVTDWFFVGNRNRNLSDNRNFFHIWSGYRNSPGNRYSFKNGILHMMNIVLLIIFLNNGLCNYLFSRNSHSFCSCYIVDLYRFSNCIKLNLFVFTSVDLKTYVFSLNNWLNISLVVNLSTRSHYSL